MIASIISIYNRIDKKLETELNLSVYEMLIAMGCVVVAIVMFIRMFYGTEISDEAYYVADAISMIHGNIPYAYNNYSWGTGSAFLLIPVVFLYELIVPDCRGIILITRLCFILFWDIVLYLGYRVLKKDYKKSDSLLITGFMIPFAGGGELFNFSYNTVPCALSYLSGLIIYDAIEHKDEYSTIKLYISGFLMGIAFFSQPGYAIAIAVFAVVIVMRSIGIKDKIKNLGLCVAGGITEILVVFIPIMVITSPTKLIEGIQYKFNPYPTGAMSSETAIGKISSVLRLYVYYVPILVVLFIVILFFSQKYVRENESKLEKKEYTILAASSALFLITLFICSRQAFNKNVNDNWWWGFVGSIGIIFLLVIAEFKKHPIILYIGIYPLIFTITEIIAVDSSFSEWRYKHAVPVMGIYLLVLLQRKSEVIRIVATVSVVVIILSIGLNQYGYIYRDERIGLLDYRVDSGVYKGIYTTKTRSHDLPELEDFLNEIVDEGELYAFRDNVPAGYLMVHKGIMCDKATWDPLNYSYHKNAPAPLYEYYQRREAFPDKYIYVDFGRDKQLSIEENGYLLNEFIETYYTKTADLKLNETFYHVIVYEYNGTFDGNFDHWIERHMYKDK